MFSNNVTEAKEIGDLIKKMAKYRVTTKDEDCECVTYDGPDLQYDLSGPGLELFNASVRLERDLILWKMQEGKSLEQRYNDHLADMADENWKERDNA